MSSRSKARRGLWLRGIYGRHRQTVEQPSVEAAVEHAKQLCHMKEDVSMFEVIHAKREGSRITEAFRKGLFFSLAEAKAARQVSGDLVVHAHTTKVVRNCEWLFSWEKDRKDSYAHKCLLAGTVVY